MTNVLAIDLGASSGRGIVYSYNNGNLRDFKAHRFVNTPLWEGENLKWNIENLYAQILEIIKKASDICKIDSLSIDSWGVDYGLLGEDGKLLSRPFHYRDKRTQGIVDNFDIMSKEELYAISGISLNEFNTSYQLAKEKENGGLDKADKMLFIPNLLEYFLTGQMAIEPTIASTCGFFDIKSGFCQKYIDKLNIKKGLFPPIKKTGELLGYVKKDILDSLNINYEIKVILGAGHDTACAVVAVPSDEKEILYISSGTWSLLGTELDEPIINELSFKENYTNEIGMNGKIRFLKNIMGMWIIQECRHTWESQGMPLSFAQIAEMASNAVPFKAFINVGDTYFNPPNDMPKRISDYVMATQGVKLESVGEIARCVYESLAMEYRYALRWFEKITNKVFGKINIIGGGSSNDFLNQLAADILDMDVLAGPSEGTAIGNAIVQLMSLGEIDNLYHARVMLKNNQNITLFKASKTDKDKIDSAYQKYLALK